MSLGLPDLGQLVAPVVVAVGWAQADPLVRQTQPSVVPAETHSEARAKTSTYDILVTVLLPPMVATRSYCYYKLTIANLKFTAPLSLSLSFSLLPAGDAYRNDAFRLRGSDFWLFLPGQTL